MKSFWISSSETRNRIFVLLYALGFVLGTSPAFSQQTSLSRSGQQVHALGSPAGSATLATSPSLFTFTFGLIDYPRSTVSIPSGIDDLGREVGDYNNTDIMIYTADHGFELKNNTFSTIDYPGASQTSAIAINKTAGIVGIFVDSTGIIHGFKLLGGVFTEIDYPGAKNETVPLGINDSGQIVGIYGDPVYGNPVGFLLSGGTYTSIAVPGATYTYAEGINHSGIIVGYYFDTSGNSHGFTWNGGVVTTIDYGNGYPNTYLASINDKGLIVGGYGSSLTISSVEYFWEHGFLYSKGTFSTFDSPFGDVQVTMPFGLNNNKEIVGGYVDTQGMAYGFYAKAQ